MQELVDETIEVNQGYKLIPEMSGGKRKLCFVAGRQGNAITLLLVSGITTATVLPFGREFAKVKTRDGDWLVQRRRRMGLLRERHSGRWLPCDRR